MSLVPDLVKLNTIPVNFEQNIETDLIETSTFQEATNVATGFARFDLQQKGFLHSQSKLFLSLINFNALHQNDFEFNEIV